MGLIISRTMVAAAMVIAFVPALADDADICAKQSGGYRHGGSTRAIASGRYRGAQLSNLYDRRGFAYYLADNFDRAIADYDQAIKIDPRTLTRS